MRLLTYNIREGGVGRAELIAEVIKAANPDVVALQEATHPAVVEQIAKLAGFKYSGSQRAQSTGFLSNTPVLNYAWRHPPRTRHALLEVSFADGFPRLFVLHLRAWFSKWSERHRVRELRGLLDGIQNQLVKEERAFAFHVLCGDFNALAPDEKFSSSPMPRWIRGMIWLSGRDIARTTIAMMRSEGYVDAWRTLYKDHVNDPGYTFPVWSPHVRLDYVFTPAAYAARLTSSEIRRVPDEVKRASDHFPLLVEIST
ncbi:MAG TPA: endonuclease/exonuclease/phosphatase family protein [Gemmatimonadaceae bacterium]|jgi:exodeoxyribonuclease-3|nr:endonuclease/exonuclease/phosphatase family protein [Gemmatimonadaceae bacterium]